MARAPGSPSRAAPFFLAGLLTAIVAAVAVAPGLLGGGSFYFRDLAGEYFPFRRLAAEALRSGRLVEWNPYVHEGIPLTLPSAGYPVDLLHMFWPDERWFSLLLALHVPLAAVGLLLLARSLGASAVAAAGGALVYALGGYSLSSVNLYRYVQALAWAPFVVWALSRSGHGGRRAVVGAAVVTAVALSTTGIEIVLQAVFAGLLLAMPLRPARAWAAPAGALGLGVGLAATTLLPLHSFVADSVRATGFPPEVVLAHSVHPLTLLQAVVGNFYGDLANLPGRWWGSNFFPRGFPYVLSLYLGAAALALAAVGARFGRHGRPLLLLLALGVTLSLGRWSGLGWMVELSPAARLFRYPVKAFFMAHLSVALLVALGLEALRQCQDGRAWRFLERLALSAGAALAALAALPRVAPAVTSWFLAGFTPPDYTWAAREAVFRHVVVDAAKGGLVAVVLGLLAMLVLKRRLTVPRATLAAVALMAADLVRTGAGLNRTVSPSLFRLSPEMTAEVARMHGEGGRVFTCDPASSRSYVETRPLLGDRHELWTFAALRETLAPNYNVAPRIPSAYSVDLTMLVPESRVLAPEEADCRSFATLEPRLRAAAVAHVISLDALDSAALRLVATLRPEAIAPLAVHVYRLANPSPLREVVGASGSVRTLAEDEDRLELEVDATGPATLLLREGFAPGWSASVHGQPVSVGAAGGRHRTLAVPAGRSRVSLEYRAAPYRIGAALSLVCAGFLLLLWIGERRLRVAASLPARVAATVASRRLAPRVGSDQRRLVLVAWALLAAVTAAPYLWSFFHPPPGKVFTGIFYYRDDFYQYVSFAEQARAGALLFRNKFDIVRHPPVLLNLEWWTAGALGRILGGPMAGFHALKIVALFALVAGAARVLTMGGLSGSRRAWALALFLTGGGLGWLRLWMGTPGWQIPDIAMGFYPFHQSLTNGHFVVGTALLLWAVILLMDWRHGIRGRWPWIAVAWVLGFCRPYDLVTLALVAGALCAADFAKAETRRAGVARALDLLWLAPVFAYYGLLVGAHPSYGTWGGQAVDLSPPTYQFGFALLPVALLWALSVLRGEQRDRHDRARAPIRRTLIVWWVVLAVLLVVWRSSLTKQSVISMGAAVLLLAGLDLPRRWLPWSTLAAAPTSAFLIWRLFNPWPDCFVLPDYFQATRALAAACSRHDAVLAPADISLMIAGLTPCSVYLGHRTLTPDQERHLEEAKRFYNDPTATPSWRLEYLDRLAIRFVLLPAGGGGLLGDRAPYARTLGTPLLEVWERRR